MMGKRNKDDRTQLQMFRIDDIVPYNHLIKKIDAAIDLSFIYDKVKDLYKPGGRESVDPVVLIKIVMIQYIFGIRSMRQTIKEIEDWTELLGDPALTTAVLDRITYKCEVIRMQGKSYRLEHRQSLFEN